MVPSGPCCLMDRILDFPGMSRGDFSLKTSTRWMGVRARHEQRQHAAGPCRRCGRETIVKMAATGHEDEAGRAYQESRCTSSPMACLSIDSPASSCMFLMPNFLVAAKEDLHQGTPQDATARSHPVIGTAIIVTHSSYRQLVSSLPGRSSLNQQVQGIQPNGCSIDGADKGATDAPTATSSRPSRSRKREEAKLEDLLARTKRG